MQIDLSLLSYDPQWYAFRDGAELEIRPFPNSRGNVAWRNGEMVLSGEERLERFMYCLSGWKGLTDADGKPLKCSEQVKKAIFDFNVAGIPEFVAEKDREFHERKEQEEKN